MNPLIPKIIGGIAVLGGLGTGTYFGAKELLREETLRQQLNKSGFKFIKEEDTAQWNLEFESDKANITKELGIDVKDGAKLKQKCKEMLDSSNKSDLEKIKKWCGIRSISNQLLRSNKKFLVNDKSSGAEAKWTSTYEKRKRDQADKSKLSLTNAWTDSKNEDLAKVKAWCVQKQDLDYSVANVETYKVTEGWCTEEGATAEFK